MTHFAGNTRVAVGVLCVAQFVVVLDVTVVATALPGIGADLGFATARLSWVITAYTVVLAGLLMLGGRLADLAGAARIFQAGLGLFTVASLACACAPTPGVLIGARIAQGAGAALLSPAALAALGEWVPPALRERALGWWTAAGAGGGASGWVLGGVITELVGWRWVFAVNVPIGVGAIVLGRRVLRRVLGGLRQGGSESSKFTLLVSQGKLLDSRGAALVTAGLGAGTFGLSRLAEDVTRPDGWLAIAISALALAAFVRTERRAEAPLVPGSLIRTPGVVGGNLTAAALTASTTPAMLAVVLYVQDTLRLSPTRGALLFPAFNVAVVAGSLLAPRIMRRAGVRNTLAYGFAATIGGIALLLTLPKAGLPAGTLLTAFVLMGTGLGTASVASTTAGTAEVAPADRGVAAGLLNSTAQLGTALGLATATPLVASAAPMTGYRLGFVAAAVIAVAGLVVALGSRGRVVVGFRGRRRDRCGEAGSRA